MCWLLFWRHIYVTWSWMVGFLLDLNISSHLDKDCPGQATRVKYRSVLWPQDRTKFLLLWQGFLSPPPGYSKEILQDHRWLNFHQRLDFNCPYILQKHLFSPLWRWPPKCLSVSFEPAVLSAPKTEVGEFSPDWHFRNTTSEQWTKIIIEDSFSCLHLFIADCRSSIDVCVTH